MIHQMVAAININIDPDLIDGRLSLTWHGLFTAVGIALGVWLALRLARRTEITADDAMNIALVAVPSGIVGARLLWVLEHTDQIRDVSDVFAVTDGGISVYGAMIGGVVGGFLYLVWFKPEFPKWVALDIAAPGMILGQAVGRFGDFVNGEHFAKVTDLPWGFRYTHPSTEGPWAVITDGNIPASAEWFRGQTGRLAEAPVTVHPVAGGYEPILDLLLLGSLLWLWWSGRVRHGWIFVSYVVGYALIRGLLALLRTDEQDIISDLSVPQFIAILTAAAAGVMAWYLLRHPQPPVHTTVDERAGRREAGRQQRADTSASPSGRRQGAVLVRKRRGGIYRR